MAIARCHGYHMIFRQSALSWGGYAPPDPLLLDCRFWLAYMLSSLFSFWLHLLMYMYIHVHTNTL